MTLPIPQASHYPEEWLNQPERINELLKHMSTRKALKYLRENWGPDFEKDLAAAEVPLEDWLEFEEGRCNKSRPETWSRALLLVAKTKLHVLNEWSDRQHAEANKVESGA